MERYEINKYIESFNNKISDLYISLKIEEITPIINELEEQMADQLFWNDPKNASEVINRCNLLKDKKNKYNDVFNDYNSIKELDEMSYSDMDAMILLEEEIVNLDKKLEDLEIIVTLSGEYDSLDAIIELHPGAGGTESMDWALMLYRMYTRYFAKKGLKYTVLDYQVGEEAGIKSVTLAVSGKFAYGLLKGEKGVHRLVRISPFDSNARRHTSFASCSVSPQFNDVSEVVINDNDLIIDVYRSSGAGGQSVNTTDSAVRITHKPTNTVVTCQNERSQIKNRETALKVLKSKLLELEIRKKEEELAKIKGENLDNGFGSQIRSYVFHPYSLVKDHRTNYEMGNVAAVMDGEIDGFISSYLKYNVR